MSSKGSFFTNSETVYTDTNPAGPSDAPLPNPSGDSRSSFFASGQQYAAIDQTAFFLNITVPGGVLVSDEWLFGYLFDAPVAFPENFTDSLADAVVGATSPTVLTLKKNGTAFGTITFTGTTAVFSGATTTFAVGDKLEMVAPTVADASLSRISITLLGTISR